MTNRALVATLVVGAVSPVSAAPARAVPASTHRCGLVSATDVSRGFGETQIGTVAGGPVGDLADPAATVTVTCTVQVGAANSTHAGADAAVVTGAMAAAGAVSYEMGDDEPVFLCTQATVGVTTWYWDAGGDDWSTSPGVGCVTAFRQQVVGPSGDGIGESRPCRMTPVADPTLANGQARSAEVDGGPVAATGLTASITLTCSIHVGAANSAHTGTDAAVVTRTGAGIVAAAATISYHQPEGALYVCTEVDVNGTVRYRNGADGSWSLVASVDCDAAGEETSFSGTTDVDADQGMWIVCAGSEGVTVCA